MRSPVFSAVGTSARLLYALVAILLSAPATLFPQQPTLVWPAPQPIAFGTPLGADQLNARALAGAPVPVPLENRYNVNGLTSAGRSFAGGFDGNGESFDAASFPVHLPWRGVAFTLGPADGLNAISASTAPLPSGNFASLLLLASLVNNGDPTQSFQVHYTDGTASNIALPLSDWVFPRNLADEAVVACDDHRNQFDGTVNWNSACMYGYSIPLDPAKTVQSITLPATRDVVVLSMVLLPKELAGTIEYAPAEGAVLSAGTQTLTAHFVPAASSQAGAVSASVALQVNPRDAPLKTALTWPQPADISFGTPLSGRELNASATFPAQAIPVDLAPYARVNAIYADGAQFRSEGMRNGTAFSQAALGTAVSSGSATFPLGRAGVPDAATSAHIAVPSGRYTRLLLLAASSDSHQLDQAFALQYSDGTVSTVTQSFSAWDAPEQLPGETLAVGTAVQNASDGAQRAATANLYAYELPVDASRTLVAVTLPPNEKVVVFGMALDTGLTPPITGVYDYQPAAGSLLAAGVQTLHVAFKPQDASAFTSATANTTVRVLAPGPHTATRTTLTALGSSALQGTDVTLTAEVTGPAGAAPTGTVRFFAGTTQLAEVPVAQGSAQFTTGALPVGAVQLYASYSGDAVFLPSQSAVLSLTVDARDFALSSQPELPGLSTRMGGSTATTFLVTPLQSFYSAPVSFQLAGDLPAGTSATFSPSLVAVDAGNTAVRVTLQTHKWAALRNPFVRGGGVFAALLVLLPGLRRRRSHLALLLVAGLFGALFALAGCGKGYAAHAYTFQVVATSGTVQHTLPLTLHIQASPQ